MAELINIILRFALYVDVLLLFGLALFALYSADSALRFRPMLRGMALIAALLSVAGLLLMTRAMSGETAFAALWPHLQMMLHETDVGLAWAIRMIALTVLLIRPGAWLASISGAVALASLAWSGHGAMDEGALRFWHFLSDILHLLAAGAWLGAMLALLLMARGRVDAARLRLLIAAVTRFEWVGAAIVLTLTITGVMNYLFIVGPKLNDVLLSTYGVLLTIKVLLFAVMLLLAALNRFHLGPALKQALRDADPMLAVNALRRSVRLELALALLIVALVAWLGTLSPEAG
ncbi:copper homeostasis membrane protein CopD [Pseudomonas granadensis]|uniref:Copper resistance protein D n=1 Tax=Pseudomonas granadensis TaxID=1421430 RepID=A0ABX7GBE5_9PSED|nr:copper homeostasis membrane protein CopD [Pseudomonas granadensis]MBN6776271.1 copper homeostasis membrane protein CopD [Pseudomonas granadensis]MBN6807289.1 copper homeostasis membrane protein CopD [Pseudomonas granadensis]MBN6834119.1 copper homeostasis membrane protein CopD [Pseudomonas granadensis]MBN6841664.1 copper homeostasis membrane protein CopD [Pseudomonas granadensis]MBN6870307.1 copper homeostasis membrane protein CopD [Pseudomonas granadensis]